MQLAERTCMPCRGGVPPMPRGEAEAMLGQLSEGWDLFDVSPGVIALRKTYGFKDFREALAFTNRVGELAEQQGHHPDIHLAWGRVVVEIWTHKIKGLTESDFIFAAKCDRL